MLAEDFFRVLYSRKSELDKSPFLRPEDQNGLETAYCVMNEMIDPPSSPSSFRRHQRARQRLKNLYFISKTLFFVVAISVSITDLSNIRDSHLDEIYSHLRHWWEENPPSENLQRRALEQIAELDRRRETHTLTKSEGLCLF